MSRFSGPDYKTIGYTQEELTLFDKELHNRMPQLEEAWEDGDITNSFIIDLIKSYKLYSHLTIKQLPWMLRAWKYHCSDDKETAPAVRAVAGGEIEYNIRIPCNGYEIIRLLTLGKASGLKHPDIRFRLVPPIAGVDAFRCYLSGPTSSFPGSCTIVKEETIDNIDKNNYLATVFADNTPVRWSFVNADNNELQRAIRARVENPVVETAKYGKETGHCSFCNLPLTHSISLHHGYGPICADRYGLPWEGEKPAASLELGLDN